MKPQDFDRLSAYIDNQLSPGEKAGLEQRLGREPELRQALDELRLTVRAVRALPTVKPPRNFTLTPAQAGLPARGAQRRPGGLFGPLRLAATFSALAFAVVIGTDLATNSWTLATAPAQDAVLTTANGQGAAAEEALTPSAESEMAIMSGEAATEESMESLAVTPESAPGGAGADVPPTGTADIAGAMMAPTPTPSAERSAAVTEDASETASDSDETATTDAYDLAQVEATASTKVIPPADATADATLLYSTEGGVPPAPEPAGLPTIRVVEAALAMLTVLLGLGAWLASRNP